MPVPERFQPAYYSISCPRVQCPFAQGQQLRGEVLRALRRNHITYKLGSHSASGV
jgi:hypothetical protein